MCWRVGRGMISLMPTCAGCSIASDKRAQPEAAEIAWRQKSSTVCAAIPVVVNLLSLFTTPGSMDVNRNACAKWMARSVLARGKCRMLEQRSRSRR